MTRDVMKWLQEVRKLDGALLGMMGVKAVQHPQLGEAVAFPYRKDGQADAAKFRTVDKRFSSTAGKSRPLYNFDALTADANLPVVITEGEIDCLSVMQAGYVRAVSLPDGWTAQGNKTDSLIAAEKLLRDSPHVIVAGDNDEAGESLPRAVANLLRGHDVRNVRWPEGCKDANDVLMKHGEGALAQCLTEAKRLDPPGGFITGLSDLPPLSHRRVLKTGDELLDKRISMECGAMSVWTGIPGHGKSTLTTTAAYRATQSEDIRCGLLAFETHPFRTRDHLSRLHMGLPFDRLAGPQRAKFEADMDRAFRLVHRTYDANQQHHLGWLEETVWTLAVRDQCKLIVIDPWNELEHLPEPGESLTNYINFALQRIRQWAETLEVHIALVAHPKKIVGEPRAPIGYDVADSAAFFNKPALGVTVHNARTESGAQYVEILTWKVRDTQLYRISKGRSTATFDPETMTYTEVDLGKEYA